MRQQQNVRTFLPTADDLEAEGGRSPAWLGYGVAVLGIGVLLAAVWGVHALAGWLA